MQCQLQQRKEQRLTEGLCCTSPVLQELCAPQLSSNELISLLGVKSELACVCLNPCRGNGDFFPHHTGLLCLEKRRALWVLLFLRTKGTCQSLYTIRSTGSCHLLLYRSTRIFPACTANLRCCFSTDAASPPHLSRTSSGGKDALRGRGADDSKP